MILRIGDIGNNQNKFENVFFLFYIILQACCCCFLNKSRSRIVLHFKRQAFDFIAIFFKIMFSSSLLYFFFFASLSEKCAASKRYRGWPLFDDQTRVNGVQIRVHKSLLFATKRHCQKFFKLEDEVHDQNLPSIDAFLK